MKGNLEYSDIRDRDLDHFFLTLLCTVCKIKKKKTVYNSQFDQSVYTGTVCT